VRPSSIFPAISLSSRELASHGVQRELLVVCATDHMVCSSRVLRSERRPSLCRLLRQHVPQRAGDRAFRDGVEGRHPAFHGARRAPPLLPRLIHQRY
jgi:hypothetical protein